MPQLAANQSVASGAAALVTLGALRLDLVDARGGPARHVLQPGKPLALLTFLALAPRLTAERDELADLLWGDFDLANGRKSLRSALSQLRSILGDSAFATDGTSVTLVAPVQVDATLFLGAIRAGKLADAVNLYAGEFIPRFASPGTDGFEDWAARERARLARLFSATCEELAQRALDAGRPPEARRLAQRLREADPQGQVAWRVQIEALLSSGDVIEARSLADDCEVWLRDGGQLAEESTAATLRTARRARAPDAPTNEHTGLAAELIGREQEFSAIEEHWVRACAGTAQGVHVIADSGLGKSRLVLDIVARHRARRERALYVRANPGEQRIPYACAGALAARLAGLPGAAGVGAGSAGALLALNPALSSLFAASQADSAIGDDALRRRGFALGELIAAVADEHPLALVIDDWHWCDEASRDALGIAISHSADCRLLVITTARPVTGAPAFDTHSTTLRLGRLTPEQSAEFVRSIASLPGESWAAHLLAQLDLCADGQPLLLLESLRLCLDTGTLARQNGEWRCPRPAELDRVLARANVLAQRLGALDDAARRYLLFCALAGTPVASSLLALAAGGGTARAETALMELEQRGHLARTEQGWCTAHDEISVTAVAVATPAQRSAALRSLGAAAAHSADPASRRLAFRLLAAAGDIAALRPLLIAEHRRSPSALASRGQLAELLEAPPEDAVVNEAWRSLPLRLRAPGRLSLAAAGAVGVAAVLLLVVATIARQPGTAIAPPDAVLLVGSGLQGPHAIQRAELRLNQWRAGTPLAAEPVSDGSKAHVLRGALNIVQPGGDLLATGLSTRDGGEEIQLRDAQGVHIVASAPGDDHPSSFSPDGAFLAITTTRWTDPSHAQVAVLDIATGVVNRLTRDGAAYSGPQWSPDGTRIALLRRTHPGKEARLCLFAAAGRALDCLPRSPGKIQHVLGWTDIDHLLAQDSTGAGLSLVTVNALSGRWAPTGIAVSPDSGAAGGAGAAALDPSGQWLAIPRDSDQARASWLVGRVGHFDEARLLELPIPAAQAGIRWLGSAARLDPLGRVEIRRTGAPVIVGVPHQLLSAGMTRSGVGMPLRAVTWSVLGRALATVDSSGVLTAHDTGKVVVALSAGGWRTAVDTVHVEPSHTRVFLEETWGDGPERRWTMFGEPRPLTVTDGRGGAALWNNGDSAYFSGAYLHAPIDARRGIAVEMEVSTPITRAMWQSVTVLLASPGDPAALATWDHRTGYIPMPAMDPELCSLTYPHGEGRGGVELFSPGGAIPGRRSGSRPAIATGRWYRLRLQLLPDGRCGVAYNGVPFVLSTRVRSVPRMARLIVEGNSVGTRILVGRVRVTLGVPSDVNWSAVRSPATIATPR